MNSSLAVLIQRRDLALDAAIAARQQHGFGSRQFAACMRLVDLYAVLVRAASRAEQEAIHV
jgi:hypothetical protein